MFLGHVVSLMQVSQLGPLILECVVFFLWGYLKEKVSVKTPVSYTTKAHSSNSQEVIAIPHEMCIRSA